VIDAVIFDLDGVLVSTDELHFQAWKRLTDSLGLPFDRSHRNRLRGRGRMESLDVLLGQSDRTYDDDERRRFAAQKNDTYRASLQTLTPDDALPGANRVLAELRERGIRLAIGSSSRNAPLILERLGWTDAFDVVVDGNDIAQSKPDPEVFLLAAQRLAVSPDRCLVVEDAMAGVEAARRAGMAVFGIGSSASLPGVAHRAGGLADVTADILLAVP
jgi:beta-phosphoglucomutase